MSLIYKTLKNPGKWLFLVALIATLGFALTSQLPQHSSFSDDATSLLVTEAQEASAEAEPLPQLDEISTIPTTTKQLQFSGNLNPHHLFYSEFASRLAFLYHIRPRSPPPLQTS